MKNSFSHINWSAPAEELARSLQIVVHSDYVGYAAWSALQGEPDPESDAFVWVHSFSKEDAINELICQLHDKFTEDA